jgi:hypothetical protein
MYRIFTTYLQTRLLLPLVELNLLSDCDDDFWIAYERCCKIECRFLENWFYI